MKLPQVKAGDVLIADAEFTCVSAGPITVEADDVGFYFHCAHGKHYLDGQLDFHDRDTLVGLKAKA